MKTPGQNLRLAALGPGCELHYSIFAVCMPWLLLWFTRLYPPLPGDAKNEQMLKARSWFTHSTGVSLLLIFTSRRKRSTFVARTYHPWGGMADRLRSGGVESFEPGWWIRGGFCSRLASWRTSLFAMP